MERLIAGLLADATQQEEVEILNLHQRLKAIYESQSCLRDAREYLLRLTEQTGR